MQMWLAGSQPSEASSIDQPCQFRGIGSPAVLSVRRPSSCISFEEPFLIEGQVSDPQSLERKFLHQKGVESCYKGLATSHLLQQLQGRSLQLVSFTWR